MSSKRISKLLFILIAGIVLISGYLIYLDFNSFRYSVPELDELLEYNTHGFKVQKSSARTTTRYIITARNSCNDSADYHTFSLSPQFTYDPKNSIDQFPVEYRIDSELMPSSYFKQKFSNDAELSCVPDNIELTLDYGLASGIWSRITEYLYQRLYNRPNNWQVVSWSVTSSSAVTQCLQQSAEQPILSVAEERFVQLYGMKSQAVDIKYFSNMYFNRINDKIELSVRGQSYSGSSVFTIPMSAYLLYELTENELYLAAFKESLRELAFDLTDEQIECMQNFNRDSFVGCAVNWNIDMAKQESPFPICEVPLIAQNMQFEGALSNEININPLLFICNEVSKAKSAYAEREKLTFDTDFTQLYSAMVSETAAPFEIAEDELIALNFPRIMIDYYANAMLSGGHYMQVMGDIHAYAVMKNYYNQCTAGSYNGDPVDYLALKRALYYRYLSTYQADSPKEHLEFAAVCDIPDGASESVRTNLLYQSGFESWYWDNGFVDEKSIFTDIVEVESLQSVITSSCLRYTEAEGSVIQEFSDIYYLLMLAALQESV